MSDRKIPAELEQRFAAAEAQLRAPRKDDTPYPQRLRERAQNLRAVADIYDEARECLDGTGVLWSALYDAAEGHRQRAEEQERNAQEFEEFDRRIAAARENRGGAR